MNRRLNLLLGVLAVIAGILCGWFLVYGISQFI